MVWKLVKNGIISSLNFHNIQYFEPELNAKLLPTIFGTLLLIINDDL